MPSSRPRGKEEACEGCAFVAGILIGAFLFGVGNVAVSELDGPDTTAADRLNAACAHEDGLKRVSKGPSSIDADARETFRVYIATCETGIKKVVEK